MLAMAEGVVALHPQQTLVEGANPPS